jgi:hypothetical protein
MSCCRRYQFGNPWDVAHLIVQKAYNDASTMWVNGDPLVNWLHCIFECKSWKEVSICVGLLQKHPVESVSTRPTHSNTRNVMVLPMPPCGVLLGGDATKPCMKKMCHHVDTYQHAYCPQHRTALILQPWLSHTSFHVWRYMADDVWGCKPDALPVGLDDGTCVDVDNTYSVPIHTYSRPFVFDPPDPVIEPNHSEMALMIVDRRPSKRQNRNVN